MADGGVSFEVRLANQVTGPAKQIQRSMAQVKKAIEQTRAAIEAPTPRNRRGAVPGFDQRLASAQRSQARDFTREQVRLAKVRAREQIKEQKRAADFHKGMAQQKLDKQAGLVDFATGGLKGGVAAIAVAGAAAAAAVGFLAFKFGEAAVQASAFAQQSRMALTFLLDSAPRANYEFEAMRREAQQLGLDVQDTQLGFQKLLAAQFEVGKAKELIRMSSDLQAIGASADQTKRAIIAISQIKNTGYLQGDELNQLREAGVSTELVYRELGKRLNKTVPEIIKMQEKRQLDSTNVIESVLAAVRQKTHSTKAGDAGKKFAEGTLIGMTAVMKARMQNAFIDIGDAMLPGLTRLMALIKRGIDSVASNPQLAELGKLLLSKFEAFVRWTELNWPYITLLLTTGLSLFKTSVELMFAAIDTNTVVGKAFIGVMSLIAVTLGIVTIAAFVLMAPLYLLIAVVGLVAYGIYKAIMWIVDVISALARATDTPEGMPTTTGAALTGPKITTAAETGAGAKTAGVIAAYKSAPPTVAGVEQGPTNNKTVNVHIGNVGTGVDKDAMATAIRSEVKSAIEETNA